MIALKTTEINWHQKSDAAKSKGDLEVKAQVWDVGELPSFPGFALDSWVSH